MAGISLGSSSETTGTVRTHLVASQVSDFACLWAWHFSISGRLSTASSRAWARKDSA
jgi:hypothetical protein